MTKYICQKTMDKIIRRWGKLKKMLHSLSMFTFWNHCSTIDCSIFVLYTKISFLWCQWLLNRTIQINSITSRDIMHWLYDNNLYILNWQWSLSHWLGIACEIRYMNLLWGQKVYQLRRNCHLMILYTHFWSTHLVSLTINNICNP